MGNYRLSELLDLTIVQKMTDAHYRAAGIPIGIIDAIDGSVLVGSGWQDICVNFHRANPATLQRCRASDNYIKDRLVEGEACHYKCQNGLWDIGMPIMVNGCHLATMFLGQFFYEGEVPDREFFGKQAREYGFDVDAYLAALDGVAVFSREKVETILEYDKALVSFIADLAENSLSIIKADEAVRASERKYHALFDQASQLLGVLSIDGRLLEINRTALSLCGTEGTNVIGKPFWETPWWAHSSELQEKVRLAVQKAAKGEFVRFEATHLASDGSLLCLDFSLKPVMNEAGEIVLLIPEGRDITARKQTEESLRKSEERMRLFFERQLVGMAITSPEKGWLQVNDRLCAMLGYSRDELQRLTWADITYPDDLAADVAQFDRLLAGEIEKYSLEKRFIRKDGTVVFTDLSVGCVRRADGSVDYVLTLLGDITEQKQAEKERLAHLHFLECMDRINQAIQGTNDLERMMSNVLEIMLSIFDCDRAWLVYPCDPEATSWKVPMERTRPGYPGALEMGLDVPIDPDVVKVFQTMRASSGPVTFGPESDQPLVGEVPELFQEQSQIALTLYPKVDKPWLFGMHQCSCPRIWTKEEKRLFQEIGLRLEPVLTSLLVHRNLKEREEKYRTLLQKIQAAVVVHGADTQILTSNTAAQNLLGLTEDQMLGKMATDPIWHFLLEDGRVMPPEKYPINQVLASRQALRNVVAGVRRPDNKNDVWVLVDADPVFDKNGEITQVIVTFIDITKRKQAEEALRESERKFKDLAEKAVAGVYLIQDGLFKYVNSTFAEFSGYSVAEMTDKVTVEEVIFPEDWPTVASIIEQRLTGDVASLQYHFRIRTKNMAVRDIEVYSSATLYQGRPAIIGTALDITERERAEEEARRLRNYLSNIINSMPSVLVGVDTDGCITHWNTAAERATGVGLAQAQGRPLDQVLPLLRRQLAKLREAMRTRRVETEAKVPRIVDGEMRYEDVTFYPLMSNGVEGAVIRVDDVTERVRIEEMMVQSEKMLSVGGLAAGMAHEINNPLGVILQASQNILRRLSSDLPVNARVADECGTNLARLRQYLERREILTFLDDIQQSGRRAAEIVTNMLNFSRKTDGQGVPTDLGELLDGTVALAASDYDLKKHYDFRQIEIVREYHPETPRVVCQSGKIQQVFLNILRNGAQAMALGDDWKQTPRFVLRVFRDEAMVRVEIEDNGRGMDETTRRRVFEPFFTTKLPGSGTGLGLSVSYFIVTEDHGGTMAVESSPGAGSRFIIRLPVEGKVS